MAALDRDFYVNYDLNRASLEVRADQTFETDQHVPSGQFASAASSQHENAATHYEHKAWRIKGAKSSKADYQTIQDPRASRFSKSNVARATIVRPARGSTVPSRSNGASTNVEAGLLASAMKTRKEHGI